jgi:hypothetical protein
LVALESVLEKIENIDEWWIDVPSRGGFDTDTIEISIKKAYGK